MGCIASNHRKLELGDGIFYGSFKTLPLGKVLHEGKYIFNEGDTYKGSFLNNKYDGEGELITKNFYYKGFWQKNTFHGKGLLNTNNFIYEGEFFKNKMNGMGKLSFENYIYIGEFINNLMQGFGKLFFNNKLIYEGRWYKNLPFKGKYLNTNEFTNVDFTQKNLENKNLKDIENFKLKIPNYDYPVPILSFNCNLCKNNPIYIRNCTHLSVCRNCSTIYSKCPICSIDLN